VQTDSELVENTKISVLQNLREAVSLYRRADQTHDSLRQKQVMVRNLRPEYIGYDPYKLELPLPQAMHSS